MVVGVAWGFAAAFREGWVGELLMRIADMLMAVPVIFLGLVLVAAFGASLWSLIVILGLLFAPATARLARSTLLVELRSDVLRLRRLGRGLRHADRCARALPERAARPRSPAPP